MPSQTAEHALRAVVYLAVLDPERPVPADRVAEALGAPANYLSKTLHVLTREGILASTPGRRGGFELAVSAAALSLAAVVDVFDDPPDPIRCLVGAGTCGAAGPCAVHAAWERVVRACRAPLENTTVADLLEGEG